MDSQLDSPRTIRRVVKSSLSSTCVGQNTWLYGRVYPPRYRKSYLIDSLSIVASLNEYLILVYLHMVIVESDKNVSPPPPPPPPPPPRPPPAPPPPGRMRSAEWAGERVSGRGRGEASEAHRGDEAADVLCMLLLYARQHGIDLDAAVARKWLVHGETA